MNNNCKIKIKLEFGSIDSKSMSVAFKFHGKTVPIENNNGIGIVNEIIKLPCDVGLIFSGKNNQTDTLVDENNNIIADLYVKILDFTLDGFSVNLPFIQKNLTLITESGSVINTPYIGFNGEMVVPLQKSSVFQQLNYCNTLSK